MADRMSPMDAYFVLAEADGVNLMHVGGVATVRGGAPSHDEALKDIAGKLTRVSRRYRQVIRAVPFQLARPVWHDAEEIDLGEHVRYGKLPSPDRSSLRTFVADVMSEQLDRGRPLWQVWVIDGVGPDEWAFLWKVHHCMMDGVSGTEFLNVLFDHSADAAPLAADDWQPDPSHGSVTLLREAVQDLTHGALDAAGSVVETVRIGPRDLAKRLAITAHENAQVGLRMMKPTRVRALNGPVGTDRAFDWTPVELADVNKVRRRFGGTVNHVVVAAALAGYRELLLSWGERVEGSFLNVLIPVSLRQRDAGGQPLGDGTMSTRATALVASLPLEIEDPVERLTRVGAELDRLINSAESEMITAFHELAGLAPTVILAAGLRIAGIRPQRMVSTVVTNVPGPRQTLYLMGREIEGIWPYAPPFPVGARTSVSVYSYNGIMHFGVTGDRASVPDVDVITDGIQECMADLIAAV